MTCSCDLCQSGESRYLSRCGACDSIVVVVHGRAEDHHENDGEGDLCPASGEDRG